MCEFPDSWPRLLHSLTLKLTVLFKANGVAVTLLYPAILSLSPPGSHQLLLGLLKYFCTLASVQPQLMPICFRNCGDHFLMFSTLSEWLIENANITLSPHF